MKVEKTCRRCGRTFTTDTRVNLGNIRFGSSGMFDYSYCVRCRETIRDRSRACDPRYACVGGHGTMEVRR